MVNLLTVGQIGLLVTCCVAAFPNSRGSDGDNSRTSGLQDAPLSATNFTYQTQLDDNYSLKWNFNSTHILFQARVNTRGYIGLGISRNGAMYPADVIIAWVKDGRVHVDDRHATGHLLPRLDASQDWHLVSGQEEGDHTTITVIRRLETCDDDDIPIMAGTTRLIYSYSPSDPVTDDDTAYHGHSRGTKSVLLLDPPANDNEGKSHLPDDVKTLDIVNTNYSIPSKDTVYSCTVIKFPPLDGKHHVIRFEPVIQEGHEMLVHHLVLYTCFDNTAIYGHVGTVYECHVNKPRAVRWYCSRMYLAWAIGGTAFDYPSHVGQPLGTPGESLYFMLEIHYDNYNIRSDFVDSSGLRMYVTKQLRQHDAGLMEIGVNTNRYQVIPPHADSFVNRGYCHPDCLGPELVEGEIHIFADFLHAHLLGKSLTTRIIRNGTELPPVLEDKTYDFNYQETRLLMEERVVKKGDTLITDCYYDSTKVTNITYGGLSSRQEMCFSFLLYYPKMPLTYCASNVAYKSVNIDFEDVDEDGSAEDQFENITKNLDWKKQEDRDIFAKIMEESDIYNFCYGSQFRTFRSSQPTIPRPYQPPDQCRRDEMTGRNGSNTLFVCLSSLGFWFGMLLFVLNFQTKVVYN